MNSDELLAALDRAYEAITFERTPNPNQLIFVGQAEAAKLLAVGYQCYLMDGRLCMPADIFAQAVEAGAFK